MVVLKGVALTLVAMVVGLVLSFSSLVFASPSDQTVEPKDCPTSSLQFPLGCEIAPESLDRPALQEKPAEKNPPVDPVLDKLYDQATSSSTLIQPSRRESKAS